MQNVDFEKIIEEEKTRRLKEEDEKGCIKKDRLLYLRTHPKKRIISPDSIRAKRKKFNPPKKKKVKHDEPYFKRKQKQDPNYAKRIGLKFRTNNFERAMLYQLRGSAKKRRLEFNLTIDDIVIPEYCPLLGIKITKEIGKGKLPSNPSMDRIDNSKGYIKGNIMIVSNQANMMKSNASKEELITFAKNILGLFQEKGPL